MTRWQVENKLSIKWFFNFCISIPCFVTIWAKSKLVSICKQIVTKQPEMIRLLFGNLFSNWWWQLGIFIQCISISYFLTEIIVLLQMHIESDNNTSKNWTGQEPSCGQINHAQWGPSFGVQPSLGLRRCVAKKGWFLKIGW